MASTVQTQIAVRVQRSDIMKALRHLTPLAKGNTIPVLACVSLQAGDNGVLTATATDMETTVRVALPAEVTSPGVCVLPAKELGLLAQYATTEELTLAEGDNLHITITAGDDEFAVEGWSRELFPEFPPIDKPFFTIQRADLTELSSALRITVGHDDYKPWLESICLAVGDTLKAISTDGFRIGMWEKPVEVQETGTAIVVPPALKYAAQLAAPGESVRVYRETFALRFSGHGFDVAGRLIEGQYPDVVNLIPKQYPTTAVVDRIALLGATGLAARWAKDGALRLDVEATGLKAGGRQPELGTFTRRLAGTISGEPLDLGINSRFLASLLRQFNGQEVALHFSGSRSPFIITCDSQSHLRYAMLPLVSY